MKHKRNILITIAYVVLVAAIPATLFFSKMVGTKMSAHIEETLNNAASLCAEMMERQYIDDMRMLEGLAVRMAMNLEQNPDMGVEIMVSTVERYGMKRIGFSTLDGNTLTTDNVGEMNLTGIDNFERAIKGESLLTAVIKDEADGEPVNIYSVPVYDAFGGEIIGVLSAVYHNEMFEEILTTSTFGDEGYTYIVDSQGSLVLDTHHPNANLDLDNGNIFDYMHAQGQPEEDINRIAQHLGNREECFWELESDKGNRFISVIPMSVNDWYVVSVVPKGVAEATKNAVMLAITVYGIAISLIAVYVVFSIRHSQREKNRLLKKALYDDSITGGRTPEKFRLDGRALLKCEQSRKAVCAYIAIDNYNLVAALYSTEERNDALRRIYEIVQDAVGSDGIVCRNGFNQFFVLFFYTNILEIDESISKFKEAMNANNIFGNMLRPSLGVYMVENKDEDIDSMMNKSKIAHENIKQGSKDMIVFYDESLRNAKYADKHFEDEMESALARHEFVPYFQPKYSAQTGKICGAEALIRWITSEGAIISPGRFIPLAENSGFIRQLDREMFSMVCLVQKHLMEQGIEPVPVSVNVSRQLMYDTSFVDDYYNKMQELELPMHLIELEITESVFFEDLKLLRSTIERLREYGFRILMDDFGTGYSSLMMLKSVPIDEIKLDKSFVDDYSDERGSSIIRCVLDLAKVLELPVVAEGVETENQYVYLRTMGCNIIQGYYFSKPLPVVEYVKKLA